MIPKPIRALIIDDSLLVRNIIADQLQKSQEIKVIATGKTGLDCVELAEKLKPDVIILDIEMPVLNGLSALRDMQSKGIQVPVVMLSVLTQHGADATLKALEYGAIDFVPKPSSEMRFDPEEIGMTLRNKILAYYESKSGSKVREADVEQHDSKSLPVRVVGIGTSTGGPRALNTLLAGLPSDFPLPILIVQHMPPAFTGTFAQRLNEICALKVAEAKHGEKVEKGRVYIAPGDWHMQVEIRGNEKLIALNQNPLVNGHRPSVEALLNSLLAIYGGGMVGVIMTGMGKDGSEAMKRLRQAGGATIAQDQDSSVIFGMNRQAIEMGGINYIEPLGSIVERINRIIKERGI